MGLSPDVYKWTVPCTTAALPSNAVGRDYKLAKKSEMEAIIAVVLVVTSLAGQGMLLKT